ncbi:general transcription factor 3C polypeptide 3 isoform X1 [Chlorella sorokiniana]|uniref:General transcription factor 3C polypeptide 3 isoform X1 n=1 Tax=Chlorella sorokiniana TaxID=3076 RepID=A0A2P6U1S0_CHLSO|nr:general transcription factor 3C polypeptide 3 isoform X1 [Chlorella sorokiniana]|eukprot:PRW60262.1 general transcription factor 3C polypeptide 3 isoform X1 [Chlorella sorokiniana]
MASSDEEFVPSDIDEEAFLQQAYGTDEEGYLQGATTEEEDDEVVADIFGEGEGALDPMALLAGMEREEALGRQAFEVLAQRKRAHRRERRAAAAAAAAHGEEEEEEEEEEDEERQPPPPQQPQQPGGGNASEGQRLPAAGQHAADAAAAAMQIDEDQAGPSSAAQQKGRRGRRGRKGSSAFGASVDEIWDDDLAEQMGLQPTNNRKKQRNKQRWRKKADARGVKRRDIPEAVSSLLGEANLLYATGQHHEAIAKLMDVIRMSPNLPDPYHTLGLLHEAVGDIKKSLDFYMIAVHLTPKDLSLWKRLAELSTQQGLVRQAIYCYNQILRRDKEDLDARYDRAMLYADMEENRKAIEGLEQVQAARPDHSEVPKALARLFHRTGQAAKAVQVLQAHLSNFPTQTDLTHVNILAELYCEAGQWAPALAICQRAERELLGPDEQLPVDLKVKAGAAHAYLGDVAAAVEEFNVVLQEPVDACADLYMDAGGVLLNVGQPDKALPFFSALAEVPEVSGPEVWARLALCHRSLDQPEQALNVYQTVVQQLGPDHPGYIDAVVALAEQHRELGQSAEAERVLDELEALVRSQDMPADHAAAYAFVLRRANILYACGKSDAFLDVTLPVLGATLRALDAEHHQVVGEDDRKLQKRLKYLGERMNRRGAQEEGGVFVGYQKYDRRKKHIRELDEKAAAILAAQGAVSGAESDGEDEAGPSALVMRELLKEEPPFNLLLQTGQVLLAQKQFQEARELLQASLDVCAKRWADKWKKDAVRLLLFEALLGLRDFGAAMQSLRPVTLRWPFAPLVWNAFGRYLTETGGVRAAAKFLGPLRQRHPTCLPLMLMVGHCHLLNTSYAEALSEYFHAYRVSPHEPLVLLCIAAALLNQAATKKVADRHRAVLQAFAFLQEYGDCRRNPQEAAYNLGRAAHHLGLLHIAVPYYERVLESAPPPSAAAAGASFDLRRDAAYNLSLIYKASGADALARQLLRQHLTV